jgi:hypothetical protein
VGVIIVIGLESAGLRTGRERGVYTSGYDGKWGKLSNFQAKKEEKRSSGFKHDLLSLVGTLLIMFGFHANNSAFSKFVHHTNVKAMWFACFVKLTISPFMNISSGG